MKMNYFRKIINIKACGLLYMWSITYDGYRKLYMCTVFDRLMTIYHTYSLIFEKIAYLNDFLITLQTVFLNFIIFLKHNFLK